MFWWNIMKVRYWADNSYLDTTVHCLRLQVKFNDEIETDTDQGFYTIIYHNSRLSWEYTNDFIL